MWHFFLKTFPTEFYIICGFVKHTEWILKRNPKFNSLSLSTAVYIHVIKGKTGDLSLV